MSKIRSLGVTAVFLAGGAVGGVWSRLVVPLAGAQQAATLTKWDYLCFNDGSLSSMQARAKQAGLDGWEMAGTAAFFHGSINSAFWCFKRPKM